MKKFWSKFIAVMLFGMMLFPFIACSEVEEESSIKEIKELRFNIQVNNASIPTTKVIKSSWENGDKVFLFFREGDDNYLDGTKYVTLTYNGTTWDSNVSAALTASELGTEGRMFGVFFPFGKVDIVSDGKGGVNFRTDSSNPALDNMPIYTYYMTGLTYYSISTIGEIATMIGSIDLRLPEDYVYFFVDKSGSDYCVDDKYRLAVEGICPVACVSYKGGNFSESSATTNGRYLGQPMWGYKYGEAGIAFSGKKDASWATGTSHKFTFFSDGDPAMSRTMVVSDEMPITSHVTLKLRAPIAANGWAQAVPTPSTTTLNGIKWADWNLGASNVSELGYYFQWGVLVVPKDYNKTSSLISDIGSNSLTGNYVIYDAARAYLGSPWRMPTKSELSGLGSIDNWIPVGNTTIQVGPTGTEFTPSPTLKNGGWKVEKNGASIFLPVSGFYDKVDTLNEIYDSHSTGCYWSSNADASYLHFYNIPSGSKWANTDTPGYREFGMQIRPIKGE